MLREDFRSLQKCHFGYSGDARGQQMNGSENSAENSEPESSGSQMAIPDVGYVCLGRGRMEGERENSRGLHPNLIIELLII